MPQPSSELDNNVQTFLFFSDFFLFILLDFRVLLEKEAQGLTRFLVWEAGQWDTRGPQRIWNGELKLRRRDEKNCENLSPNVSFRWEVNQPVSPKINSTQSLRLLSDIEYL